jgi:hypothetical protein
MFIARVLLAEPKIATQNCEPKELSYQAAVATVRWLLRHWRSAYG